MICKYFYNYLIYKNPSFGKMFISFKTIYQNVHMIIVSLKKKKKAKFVIVLRAWPPFCLYTDFFPILKKEVTTERFLVSSYCPITPVASTVEYQSCKSPNSNSLHT